MRLVLAVSAFLIVSHAAGVPPMRCFQLAAGNLKVQTVASGLCVSLVARVLA